MTRIVPITEVVVREGRRPLQSVAALAESIRAVGLLHPILVTKDNVLVAGAHRLAACTYLGHTTIATHLLEWDAEHLERIAAASSDLSVEQVGETLRRLVEIDENVMQHRLSALDEAIALKTRKELFEKLHPQIRHGGNRKHHDAESSRQNGDLKPFAEDTAEKVGKGRRTIERKVQIGEALEPVADLIRGTSIEDSQKDLEALSRIDEADARKAVIDKIRAGAAVNILDAQRQLRKETLGAIPPVDGRYRVLYADPPWRYSNAGIIAGDAYGHAERHYSTLSIDDLCGLDVGGGKRVKDITEANAILFLWATAPMLMAAARVIDAWGFNYKTSLVWDKVRHNFGHYFSVRHEHLLVCTHGSCTPDASTLHDSVVVIERSGRHSEKPARFRELIDELYPHGNRIELFARHRVDGWDAWGLEVPALREGTDAA